MSEIVDIDNKKHAEKLFETKTFLNLKSMVYSHEKLNASKVVITKQRVILSYSIKKQSKENKRS